MLQPTFLGAGLLTALALPLSAQAPSLLKDIETWNRGPSGSHSFPWEFHSAGLTTFFSAFDPAHGRELYSTLGRLGSTRLVRDIAPGGFSADPGGFTTLGRHTYFAATTGRHGRELWRTDGTTVGTVLVKDVQSGPAGSLPTNLVAFGGTVCFFSGNTSPATFHGGPPALWKSDGTAAGTVRVRTFARPDLRQLETFRMRAYNGALILAANDGRTGLELWRSDGTATGTVLLRDIAPGASTRGIPHSSGIRDFTEFQGKLYFFAGTASHQDQDLWVTDGTTAGTQRVKDLARSQTFRGPGHLTVFRGALWFAADPGLWRSDGTTAGTVSIHPTPAHNFAAPTFAHTSSHLYYWGGTFPSRLDLWRTDGTTAGTVRVVDIQPATPRSGLIADNGRLYFSARDASTGEEPWTSDGTAAGTRILADINTRGSGPNRTLGSNPRDFQPLPGGGLIFSADGGQDGIEPWITSTRPRQLFDIHRTTGLDSAGSHPDRFLDVQGTVFFTAQDSLHGREVWRTDGTAPGTFLVRDIHPGPASANATLLGALDGHVMFHATGATSNRHGLWKSSGISSGPTGPYEGATFLREMTIHGAAGSQTIGDTLYFAGAARAVAPLDLWQTDGTTAGTKEVYRFPRNAGSPFPLSFQQLHGILYFMVHLSPNVDLWRSDGTAAGTRRIRPTGSRPKVGGFVTAANQLYFTAALPATGTELWRSDGTAAGTQLIMDIEPGPTSSILLRTLTPVGDRVFFTAQTRAHGAELWVSDGTTAGTRLVRDLWTGTTNGEANSSQPGNGTNQQFAVLGDTVFFHARTSAGALPDLWKSDGTATGTQLVKRTRTTLSGWEPTAIRAVSDRHVVFTSRQFDPGAPARGAELWISDGTTAGTRPLADIHPGAADSRPVASLVLHGKLLVAAEDGRSGRELHAIPLGAVRTSFGQGCPPSAAPQLDATDPVLGSTLDVAFQARPRTDGFLLLGVSQPNPARTSLGAGCHIYIDVARTWAALPVRTDARGAARLRLPVPNVAAFDGARFVAQAAFGRAPTFPRGIEWSPGLRLTLGR